MPLITITTSGTNHSPVLTNTAYALGEALPGLVAGNCSALHIREEDTPEQGVQVDFKEFHRRAVNAPDIWIHFQFAEAPPAGSSRIFIRAALKGILLGWFKENGHEVPNIALDIFWGPSHGFYQFGEIKHSW